MIPELIDGFLPFADTLDLELPFAGDISAGLPISAADYIEDAIDLNKELVSDPFSTFVGKVKGFTLASEGIAEDDILVVDKSVAPLNKRLAICLHNGQYSVKRITEKNRKVYIISENPHVELTCVHEGHDYMIWGIVTYIIKKIV